MTCLLFPTWPHVSEANSWAWQADLGSTCGLGLRVQCGQGVESGSGAVKIKKYEGSARLSAAGGRWEKSQGQRTSRRKAISFFWTARNVKQWAVTTVPS